MQKLIRKQDYAGDVMEQLRALPSNQLQRVMEEGVLKCELTWNSELELDAGRLGVHLVEVSDAMEVEVCGRIKSFNLRRSRQTEKVLAATLERAWVECVVHNRTLKKGGFPRMVVLLFKPQR